MKERYNVLKEVYPDYLILILKKDKIYSFNEDKDILNMFNFNVIHINKLILNNLDIEGIYEFDDNIYCNYYIKIKLINCLERRV